MVLVPPTSMPSTCIPIYCTAMFVLSGADLVLADAVRSPATLIVEGDRIIDVLPGSKSAGGAAQHIDLSGHVIAPGFVDVHVHGVDGTDVLDGDDAVAKVAGHLPKYGVTAFCPTTVACSAD